MKRLLALLLVITVIGFCFAGCKSEEEKAMEALEDALEDIADEFQL